MLKEVLSGIADRPRQFLLLRMVGVDKTTALSSLAVPEGTYRRWVTQIKFKGVYQRIGELGLQYRDAALMMLRDVNYALVVKLEEKMLQKLLDEIAEGTPVFAKTNLGREIYAKLASEMSTRPQVQNVTWEQLVMQSGTVPPQAQISEGDGNGHIEAESSEDKEFTEGILVEDSTPQNL